MDSLTYVDEKDNYFVTFHQKNDSSHVLSEIFILIPLKDSKTLVIFMTNFDIGLNLPYFLRQMIKEERLNILSNFKQFVEYNEFNLTNLSELVVNLPRVRRKSTFAHEQNNNLFAFSDPHTIMEEDNNSSYDEIVNFFK
jgi:hypothetical protein